MIISCDRLAVEVADFDFGQTDEEELQYKSFWERLRESFGEFNPILIVWDLKRGFTEMESELFPSF